VTRPNCLRKPATKGTLGLRLLAHSVERSGVRSSTIRLTEPDLVQNLVQLRAERTPNLPHSSHGYFEAPLPKLPHRESRRHSHSNLHKRAENFVSSASFV
jgi:hypothetical protein